MDIHELIFVPLILFMIFVAPLWVIMHYRSKGKMQQGLTDAELQQLNNLAVRAEKMADTRHIQCIGNNKPLIIQLLAQQVM